MSKPLFKPAGNAVAPSGTAAQPWKVLIADDDDAVHQVTRIALSDFKFENRPLELLSAITGAQAVEIMRQEPDIAIVLMDVVMETDHAGLDAIRIIREELNNRFVRIILRTGEPGQAPERHVITNFDINDYKEKTELTATRLYSSMYTALGAYRSLTALDQHRRGLEKVIDASANLLSERGINEFAQGVLEQLSAILYVNRDVVMVSQATEGLAASRDDQGKSRVIAGTGRFAAAAGVKPSAQLDTITEERISRALGENLTVMEADHFLHGFRASSGRELALYISLSESISVENQDVIALFCKNVALTFDNVCLQDQLTSTQSELILMLSEAIERRSLEAGNHVRRVAEYSALMGRLFGLEKDDIELLRMASPLHDAGKIAIPDAVLNKPGKLDGEELVVMRSHAAIGGDIFSQQKLPVLKAAGIIAYQHHEKWDGTGYPLKLKGEEIHPYGRIVALADVFDALLSTRCYKEPWPLDRAMEYIRLQSGRQFDPRLVELMETHIDEFLEVRERLQD